VKRRRLGLSTRAIHGDPKARADWTAVAPPLYQSSTFTNPVGSTAEVLYTRYGNNPNQVDIGKKLALLEGADAALFLGSGMGAVALAHLAVLRPGDHLLASEWIYGGVHRLFREEFGKLGIDVAFVNPTQQRTWKRAMRKTTRAVFVETPTNPLMRVIDLEPVAALCKEEGLALIVDSTFASPVNCRPIEHGADIVIHSATKYLNGHSDVIAGAVAGTDQVVEEVRRLMQVGPGHRSVRGLVDRSRHADAHGPCASPERNWARRGGVVRQAGRHCQGALSRSALSPRSRVGEAHSRWIRRYAGD